MRREFCSMASLTQSSGLSGIGARERHVVAGFFKHVPGVAGQLAQDLAAGREIALGLDQCRRCGVECSLGVLYVRDGDQADLEALFRLFELAADRVVRRLRGFERVLRRQHVEVRFGRADDQVLLGDQVIGFGLGLLGVGAAERRPVLPS